MVLRMTTLTTLADGRHFPSYQGEPLSWSIGFYHTGTEQQLGFPRMRAVIQAMLEHGRGAQVEAERREMVRASFNCMFGHNAKVALKVIEEELAR